MSISLHPIKVVIADHQKTFRQRIVTLLAREPGIAVVGQAANEKELLAVLDNNKVDVLLLDISIPLLYGNLSFQSIKQRYPDVHVIILSSFLDKGHIHHYLTNGASACLEKNCAATSLIQAIKLTQRPSIIDNKSLVPFRKRNKKKFAPDQTKRPLTERETEILYHICSGKTNKEIAACLNITLRTVDFHRSNLYQKTETVTGAALAVYAIRNGLLAI